LEWRCKRLIAFFKRLVLLPPTAEMINKESFAALHRLVAGSDENTGETSMTIETLSLTMPS
jgi:hypothetical protein